MSEPTPKQLTTRNELIRHLENLCDGYDPGTMPIVDAERFFEDNFDEASISPNSGWKETPSFPSFVSEIDRISKLPNVDSIAVSVLEWPDEDDEDDFDMWPQGENLVVVTSMNQDELALELSKLQPDGIRDGWAYDDDGRPVDSLPHVPSGSRLYTICWD